MAALLAVAMMLQMLPMLAFAEDAPGTGEVRNKRTGKTYTSLVTAVTEAGSGDTIELGEGNYTLFEKKNNHAKAGNKDLTFVGQGLTKRPGISVMRCRTRASTAQSITAITALMVLEKLPSKI